MSSLLFLGTAGGRVLVFRQLRASGGLWLESNGTNVLIRGGIVARRSVMRVACLLAIHLPVQVERQHNPSLVDGPLVVGGRPWDPGAVLDCCSRAEAAGIEPGMRLPQAETLCPTARFVPAHEESYRTVHDALVAAAECFTPTVESTALGMLYAEVSGLEMRFGPDSRIARRIALEVEQVLCLCPKCDRLDVRIGLGSSKFVAEQAACAAHNGCGQDQRAYNGNQR